MTAVGAKTILPCTIADEVEEGKQAFIELVRGLDPEVQCVIPTAPSNNMFLMGLAKGKAKQFLSVSEDDLIDLPQDETVRQAVLEKVNKALGGLGG